MKESQTPLMRQYNQIKQKYPDTVMFFRMGDFFETFENDAVITSKVCGITLTKRNNGDAEATPLAGFPHHQLDAYLPKMVRAGYRVAVCEQLEDPKLAKGIVRRGVVEVVTPGVALYDKLLDSKLNNYICCLFVARENSYYKRIGVAVADVSTGEFLITEILSNGLSDLITSLAPAEIIISKSQLGYLSAEFEKLSYKPSITKIEEWLYEYEFALDKLLRHFTTISLKGFGIDSYKNGISSAGALLNYISENQLGIINQIKTIRRLDTEEFISLDPATRRNLEITYSANDASSVGTLISVIDKTSTPMGGRMLKKWLSMPLKSLDKIHSRQNAVEGLFNNPDTLENLSSKLKEIGDIERLISKICTGKANPRDTISLANSISKVPDVKRLLELCSNEVLDKFSKVLNPLKDVINLIFNSIKDEPSIQMGSGSIFKTGYDAELDSYIEAKFEGKNWIADYQESERQSTGIPSLKIGFTSVFGYYIEVTKTHTSKVPSNYDRKQTLTNAERYTTQHLREIEQKILGAEEKITELETKLFSDILKKIAEYTEQIQELASNISKVDCIHSFAKVSLENNYTKPIINDSDELQITEGRHPIVEQLLPKGTTFTPNSTVLNRTDEQIHIITGPNMSGKSCYLRQVAVIVLLGQVGCFVPAAKAEFGIVDKIFTRVGAQDNITAGESTFLVEMQEAANILNNATNKSLILLDEVGRGTATFDGISIAWAIAEYIHNHIGAKTLFATHYHELNDLETRYSRIKNYRVEVIETGSSVIFSHKVARGGSDYSFGIHVAKMAGLPYEVIERANEIMKTLEDEKAEESSEIQTGKRTKPNIKSIKTKKASTDTDQLAIFEIRDDAIRERIADLKIDNMTPIQAFNFITELQREIKKN